MRTLWSRFALPDGRFSTLSKGEQMRVRLVAALSFRPRLVLLDEPTGGLDLGNRLRLIDTVRSVVAGSEVSVIVSSHQLQDVERMADRLLVLGGGRVVGDGTLAELVGPDRTIEDAMIAWGLAA